MAEFETLNTQVSNLTKQINDSEAKLAALKNSYANFDPKKLSDYDNSSQQLINNIARYEVEKNQLEIKKFDQTLARCISTNDVTTLQQELKTLQVMNSLLSLNQEAFDSNKDNFQQLTSQTQDQIKRLESAIVGINEKLGLETKTGLTPSGQKK